LFLVASELGAPSSASFAHSSELRIKHRRATHSVRVALDGAHLELVDPQTGALHRFEVVRQEANQLELRSGASHETVYVYLDGTQLWVAHRGRVEVLELLQGSTLDPLQTTSRDPNLLAGTDLHAPMTGRVNHVDVQVGELVARGQRLLTLEAMKMELAVCAELEGTVVAVHCAAGASVYKDDLLVALLAS